MHTSHFHFFHQPLVIGINGIQSEYHVVDVVLAMSGTIQDLEQGIEQLYAPSGGVALVRTQHTLRFINDHDGIGLGKDVDRTT